MRILYVTTVSGTMRFFYDFIKMLTQKGHIVDIATNGKSRRELLDKYTELGCEIYNISTSRSPFSFGNIKAIKQIREIAKGYDIVHCHTPLAGMATRLACRKLRKKQGLKVIYTAHGFHFYKGAPKKNWLIYYPIEKICSKWTDVLITINKEDYELAKKKMKAKRIEYVPGVGIDTEKFASVVVDRDKKREELGIPKDAVLILSVGELSKRKNHKTIIKALAKADKRFIYIIAGEGKQQNSLTELISKLKLEKRVFLLGYRNDINNLCNSADVFVLPSIQEGLPVALMEAMAAGLPCVASKIRGNTDLLEGVGEEFLCDPTDAAGFAEKLDRFASDETLRKEVGKKNLERIKEFDTEIVNNALVGIYSELNG